MHFETYSARSYSAWHECFEYLIERCGFNPIIVCDLILLLVQEAQKPSGIEVDRRNRHRITWAFQSERLPRGVA